MNIKYIFIVFCIVHCSPLLHATTIWVDAQKNNTVSITKALEIANSGDTVLVFEGVYKEKNIVIRKPVVLIGSGTPVLDGENEYEIISVHANNVVVRGFEIKNSGTSGILDIAGLKIYNARYVTVSGNKFTNCFFGIYAQQCADCLIENNELTAAKGEKQQSGNGIHCWKCDSMQIIANTIAGHRDGIYFEFVTNSIIWRNTSTHNLRYGLHFMFSNQDTYAMNIFENNGAGVSVMFSHDVHMYHNYFTHNWGDGAYGILLKEISDSYVEGNYFTGNTTGIYMEGASRIHMIKNVFRDNGWGLKIQASSMDVELTNNNFLGNTFDVATNGSLVLNKFNNNYWDKYEGYDLNKDKIGDVPYRPVSMYSMIIEKYPPAMLLFHSLITTLLDRSEKVIPSLTPESLKDNSPLMQPLKL